MYIKRCNIIILFWVCLAMVFSLSCSSVSAATPKPEIRTDGLTIIRTKNSTEKNSPLVSLTMILKNGYASDPEGKAGLTELTNQLIYRLLLNSSALDIQYHTYADLSRFSFVITSKNFTVFCSELDSLIRTEALLMYDACNDLIQDNKNEPQIPGSKGANDLYKLLYGNSHPYLAVFNDNFPDLDINTVNNWFRKIYRFSNLLIVCSADLPTDFLMKPSGRELTGAVSFPPTPVANCVPKPIINVAQIPNNISTIYIGLPGPSLSDSDFFAMVVYQRYLQKELWNKLRESMGLCYDVQVSYTYLQESSSPSLLITLATLPEDTDLAVASIMEILKSSATKSIPTDQLIHIKEQEKYYLVQNRSWFQTTDDVAFEKYFKLTWFSDDEEYLKLFNQITVDDLTKLIASRLKYLKVVVNGPITAESFKQSYQVLTSITKLSK